MRKWTFPPPVKYPLRHDEVQGSHCHTITSRLSVQL